MRVTAGVKASSISPANAPDSHPDQCDLTARAIANALLGSEKDRLNLGGTIRLRHDVNDI
jgi:hypothetical protein